MFEKLSKIQYLQTVSGLVFGSSLSQNGISVPDCKLALEANSDYVGAMVFQTASARQKITEITAAIELAFKQPIVVFPADPARDVQVLMPRMHPDKKGLSYKEGQARLLHDLASIELQAMELGLRTLHEFPEAPVGFREELAAVTLSESQHLTLCLDGIERLGFHWGDWPVHNLLWGAVGADDSLLDRILIVHRYLEGSGLDAGDTLMRRLDAVLESPLHSIARTIFNEEVGHVEFGSRWYREICALDRRDAQADFPVRMNTLREKLPKRTERISREMRLKAGFTMPEIEFLESWRTQISKF
jgi:uncharacterized ferritin-like protein (DUF455 family)